MKCDEVVDVGEEGADLALLGKGWQRNVYLHHLPLRDVIARNALGKKLYLGTKHARPQHICKVKSIEGSFLPVAKAEAVQIDISQIRKPE